jgi:hypothetical protein
LPGRVRTSGRGISDREERETQVATDLSASRNYEIAVWCARDEVGWSIDRGPMWSYGRMPWGVAGGCRVELREDAAGASGVAGLRDSM